MPPPAPRTFYVITTRGDAGPFTRDELREQLDSGAVRPEDRVRNAFGRPLGTVANALSDASSGRSPAHGNPPVEEPPAPPPAPRRSPFPLIIGLAVVALIGAVVILRASQPIETPPAPAPAPPTPVPAPVQPAADPTPVATPAPVAPMPTQPAAPDGALPGGWSLLDLGDARPKGKAVFAAGLWTIDGGGEDIWGKRDECAFVHQEQHGDFTMTVRLQSVQSTHAWDKIGVMVRSTTDPSSPMVALTVTHGGTAQLYLRGRAKTSVGGVGSAKVSLPVWLQLTRRGCTFGGYWSADGTSWTGVGEKRDVAAIPETARLGLAVCSHNRSIANRAVFGDVSIAAPR